MLDVRRLRLLHEFQLRGTLAEVARALSYSPSFISQQMALLERETGAALLRRSGRRVHLTAQGELLATRAGEILDRLERAEAELAAQTATIAGTVRLAVFQSVAHTVLPRAVALLAGAHPGLRVEIVEREPELGLFETTARDFDLVVAEQYPGMRRPRRKGIDHVTLGEDDLLLVSARAGRHTAGGLSDAETAPWVMEPRDTASRSWVTQMCRGAGFEPDVRFETPDLVTHLRLIERGEAVGVLPALFLASLSADVVVRSLPSAPRREVFSATRTAAAPAPAITAVRTALADAYADVLEEIPAAG
ncbi:DNA-binding transcriptional LysR family regulator [Microbacterium resistens]|uniref:DNA-binding transcriptional LysR family regulator n=1 Tax=Microbacterium resistens TaxID=156977 RepID=A0ABU1SGA5_9MICO|nr:LysR substrate-binding domain-containing protein [Microbacterium resistens]MDR6867983.1 DNA-binding transcriptional LysR family regulator [Microbacterium resistens]